MSTNTDEIMIQADATIKQTGTCSDFAAKYIFRCILKLRISLLPFCGEITRVTSSTYAIHSLLLAAALEWVRCQEVVFWCLISRLRTKCLDAAPTVETGVGELYVVR
jgi:hypothetical protein